MNGSTSAHWASLKSLGYCLARIPHYTAAAQLQHTLSDRHLAHYARLGEASLENWQDRLMQMDGVTAAELSKLHGELIAFGWIEQNTGQVSTLKPGAVPSCYRIT